MIVGGRDMINKNISSIGTKLDGIYNDMFREPNIYIVSIVWIIKNKANLLGMRTCCPITKNELMDLLNATSILLEVTENIAYYIYPDVKECLFLLECELNRHNTTTQYSIIQNISQEKDIK